MRRANQHRGLSASPFTELLIEDQRMIETMVQRAEKFAPVLRQLVTRGMKQPKRKHTHGRDTRPDAT